MNKFQNEREIMLDYNLNIATGKKRLKNLSSDVSGCCRWGISLKTG